MKGRVGGAFLTAVEQKPWEVRAPASVAIAAWGREDGPRMYTEARVEGEGLHQQEILSSVQEE